MGAGIAGLNAAFKLLKGYSDLDDSDQNYITIFEANSDRGRQAGTIYHGMGRMLMEQV